MVATLALLTHRSVVRTVKVLCPLQCCSWAGTPCRLKNECDVYVPAKLCWKCDPPKEVHYESIWNLLNWTFGEYHLHFFSTTALVPYQICCWSLSCHKLKLIQWSLHFNHGALCIIICQLVHTPLIFSKTLWHTKNVGSKFIFFWGSARL
jgi:hypothetical protein